MKPLNPRIALLTLLTLTAALSPVAGAGTNAAEFLRVNPDSRSAALGNSGVADAASGFAVLANPALLSASEDWVRLAGGQTTWLMGVSAAHYATSFSWGRRADERWGLGVSYSDWRSAPFQARDAHGKATGEAGYAAGHMGVGLAHTLTPDVHVGLAVKRVSEGFTEGGARVAAASAMAFDLGLMVETPLRGVRAGAAAQNLGSGPLTFLREHEALPRQFRAGVEGEHFGARLDWSVEAAQSGRRATVKAGASYAPLGIVALRFGYDARLAGPGLPGLTTGLGFRLKNLSMDYALVPFGDLGVTQRVSLTWALGRTLRKGYAYGGRPAAGRRNR